MIIVDCHSLFNEVSFDMPVVFRFGLVAEIWQFEFWIRFKYSCCHVARTRAPACILFLSVPRSVCIVSFVYLLNFEHIGTPRTAPTTMTTTNTSNTSNNPNSTSGKKAWHPFRDFNNKAISSFMSHEEKMHQCVKYLEQEVAAPFCYNRVTMSKNKKLSCQCLHVLDGNELAIESVVRYMLFFHKKKK